MLINTYSGKSVNLTCLQDGDFCLEDIAFALSNLTRFAGHNTICNVAHHSILVYEWVRDNGFDLKLQLAALFHDAHEAYTGELPKAMKDWVRQKWNEAAKPNTVDPITDIEQRLDYHIRHIFGIGILSTHEKLIIKEGDNWVCAREAQSGWDRKKRPKWVSGVLNDTKPSKIESYSPEHACYMFKQIANHIKKEMKE